MQSSDSTDNHRKSAKFLMFDISPDDANLWFNISNVVLVVGAALVAISTYGSIQFAAIREKYADRETAKANERIAELSMQSEQLRKDTAEANRKAEQERLERLKLEASVAPRSLSVAQQVDIAAAWRTLAGKRVAVVSYAQDIEAAAFAGQIVATLQAAGADVLDRRATWMSFHAAAGVVVMGSDFRATRDIMRGLARAQIQSLLAPLQPGGVGGGVPDDAAAVILVGFKPIATLQPENFRGQIPGNSPVPGVP